jgi:hypothetical protein
MFVDESPMNSFGTVTADPDDATTAGVEIGPAAAFVEADGFEEFADAELGIDVARRDWA